MWFPRSVKNLFLSLQLSKVDISKINLYLAHCLFVFIRNDQDSKEVQWQQYLEALDASCRGVPQEYYGKAIEFCLGLSPYNQNTIDGLTEETLEEQIDDGYKKLFTSALFLRYAVKKTPVPGTDFLEKAFNAGIELDTEIRESLKSELEQLDMICHQKFHICCAHLIEKGGDLTTLTTSPRFALAVMGYREVFKAIPDNKIEFAVGYYFGILLKLSELSTRLIANVLLPNDDHKYLSNSVDKIASKLAEDNSVQRDEAKN